MLILVMVDPKWKLVSQSRPTLLLRFLFFRDSQLMDWFDWLIDRCVSCAVVLDFWDTAGQERFKSMHPSYYHRADACILVFDVTRRVTYDNLKAWYDLYSFMQLWRRPSASFLLSSSLFFSCLMPHMHDRYQELHEYRAGIPTLVVANKIDGSVFILHHLHAIAIAFMHSFVPSSVWRVNVNWWRMMNDSWYESNKEDLCFPNWAQGLVWLSFFSKASLPKFLFALPASDRWLLI